jgi:hypothetical protein
VGERVASVAAEFDEVDARWERHPLFAAETLIRECLEVMAPQHLIVIGDADGTLLRIEGDPATRLDAEDTMNFAVGAGWSEAGAGTNAVGIALADEHAVQVFAGEHFNSVVQAWVCSAAPVRDPDSGELVGVIDLTSRMDAAHPHVLATAVATAKAVEAKLRGDMYERDARVRARYGDRVDGRARRALVAPSGRVLASGSEGWLSGERLAVVPGGGEIVLPSGESVFAAALDHEAGYVVHALEGGIGPARRSVVRVQLLAGAPSVRHHGESVRLSPRHAELLALLILQSEGIASEKLAADMYGDAGRPASVRVEMSRLRKVIGGRIEADPYRLAFDIESDLGHMCGLLSRGAAREAAEIYSHGLLPRSEAPGVIREREELEHWLRQLVMTSDEVETLWAWVNCPPGREDQAAWRRLVSDLPFRDPRRALAAASLQALRDAYERRP